MSANSSQICEFEVKTSVTPWLARYLCVTLACSDRGSTKSLVNSCGFMCKVQKWSVVEAECELNYQKHRRQGGKKDLTFLTQKKFYFRLSLKTFDNCMPSNCIRTFHLRYL